MGSDSNVDKICSIDPDPMSATKNQPERWSQRVTETSRALDLEAGVFTLDDPRRIARSLLRSAAQSRRRKSTPFRSAMSMLNFYINRAGKNLPRERRVRLEAAKRELRKLNQRQPGGQAPKKLRETGPGPARGRQHEQRKHRRG